MKTNRAIIQQQSSMTGVIKQYDIVRGYGFIQPTGNTETVFLPYVEIKTIKTQLTKTSL